MLRIPAVCYPSRVSRNPKVYATLAGMARSWGYEDVTGAVVHDWRKRGFLTPVIVRHLAFGKVLTEIPAATVERLRAICRARYDSRIRDRRLLGLILWLDGADIPMPRVRDGAIAAATVLSRALSRLGAAAKARDPDDQDADVDAAAVGVGRGAQDLVAVTGGEQVPRELVEVGVAEFLLGMTGRVPLSALDPEALGPLGLAIGLGRAAREAPEGAEPWLVDTPGAALRDVIAILNEPNVVRRITGASDHELLQARELAADLERSLSRMAELFGLFAAPGQFGFGFLRLVRDKDPIARMYLFLNAAVIPDLAQQAADAFRASTAEFEGLVLLGQQWLGDHPELAGDAANRGLRAVVLDWISSEQMA